VRQTRAEKKGELAFASIISVASRRLLGAPRGHNAVRSWTTTILAEWTGLEPATPGVTGRYSNQLNYHSSFTAQLHSAVSQRMPAMRTAVAFDASRIL
jgi:hypothetical protein